jgi:hypothetical protein
MELTHHHALPTLTGKTRIEYTMWLAASTVPCTALGSPRTRAWRRFDNFEMTLQRMHKSLPPETCGDRVSESAPFVNMQVEHGLYVYIRVCFNRMRSKDRRHSHQPAFVHCRTPV